jgi:hypothetical protein
MRSQIKIHQPSKRGNKKRIAGEKAANSTKAGMMLTLLRRPRGATVAELSKATGWQEHSVRGYISGTLKKRKGLEVLSEKDGKGARRYRVADHGC